MDRLGRPDWVLRHRRLGMFCLRSYALLGSSGIAGPDGGLRAMGRSRGGAARRNAVQHRRPQAQPGLRAAGSGPRWNLPGATRPSHVDRGPTGTRAVSGLRERRAGVRVKPERRAGVRVKPEQAPQGATGRGLGWNRGPQVDRRRSTILEQSCGRRTGGATVGSYMCHRSRTSITNCNRR